MLTDETMAKTKPGALGHLCVDGELVTYDPPPPDVAAFLERVRRASEDPAVSEDALIALIYGRENPLLDHTLLPGASMVTPAVFENPLYRVLTDLLGRKRVQLGTLDLVAARARYTMTVTEAAAQLGTTPQAVRLAIEARRLAAWRDGKHALLDPQAVAAFKLARRGPSPHLAVRLGSAPGLSFRVKHPGALEDVAKPAPGVTAGTLTLWKRVAVITGEDVPGGKRYRMHVLAPSGSDGAVEIGDFHVRGRFRVVETIDDSDKAHAAWRAFKAE